nr:thymidylate kinase-like protein [Oryctes rhinoceros nudivirus]
MPICEKYIDEQTAISIVNFNIGFPVCSYSDSSRRTYAAKPISILDRLSVLDGWDKFDVIAIDGQNGTTKSTLCHRLMRHNQKINNICSEITCGPNYNFMPIRSLEYLFMQLYTESHDTVWDRCPYSNLIFYYVHHLMEHFKNTSIPADFETIWPIFNALAYNTNLSDTIYYTKSIKHIPTLFFVCSDIDYISKSLCLRAINTGSVNDLWNSKEYNYQMAQYHAYVWFGKLLDYPVFDLSDFLKDGYSIDDIHTMIASKIDKRPENPSCMLPDREDSQLLNSLLLPLDDDVLVYEYSKK